MNLTQDGHTAIEFLRIHIIQSRCKTANEVLDIIKTILTEDKI